MSLLKKSVAQTTRPKKRASDPEKKVSRRANRSSGQRA